MPYCHTVCLCVPVYYYYTAQEGKTPPGIKQIPNNLSTDQASASTGVAPSKPWEQK